MKKKVSIITVAILCVAFLAVGAVATKFIDDVIDESRRILPTDTLPDSARTKNVTSTPKAPQNETVASAEEQVTDPNQQTAASEEFIGADAAKEIALQKAGITSDGVVFDRVELDHDDGVWRYEVEFRKGLTEYEADIAAIGGKILSWDVDKD